MPITKQLLRIKLDTLVPYERNTKIHSENIDDIIKSIERNEYITPILIDEENIILAGHGRKLALEKMGVDEEEVIKVT